MKRNEELKIDDVIRNKADRRSRNMNDKMHKRESEVASRKPMRKKSKKFVFNQNFDLEDWDIYDE